MYGTVFRIHRFVNSRLTYNWRMTMSKRQRTTGSAVAALSSLESTFDDIVDELKSYDEKREEV